MRALMTGALETARDKGADVGNAVAMGYCFGGAAVLEWARSGAELKGFVTFHGGLKTPAGQDYSRARGNILIMHGTADSAITMDQFAGLAKELEAAGIDHEMITYGGAQHAFTVFGGEPLSGGGRHEVLEALYGIFGRHPEKIVNRCIGGCRCRTSWIGYVPLTEPFSHSPLLGGTENRARRSSPGSFHQPSLHGSFA
jgi:hypothetical protein